MSSAFKACVTYLSGAKLPPWSVLWQSKQALTQRAWPLTTPQGQRITEEGKEFVGKYELQMSVFYKMWPSLFLFPFGDGVLYLNARHIQSPRSPVSLTSTFITALKIHPPSLSMNNWGLPVEILQSEAEGGGGAQWLQGTGWQLNN